MDADAVCFDFDPETSLSDAEMTLHLAMFAVEGVLGRARVRLDAEYVLDEEAHAIVIDGGTEVGELLARVFTGLLLREFGEDAFTVRRCDALPESLHAERTVAT